MCQGCTLDQSVASGTGGAVYLDSAASITLEDMSITNSHAFPHRGEELGPAYSHR